MEQPIHRTGKLKYKNAATTIFIVSHVIAILNSDSGFRATIQFTLNDGPVRQTAPGGKRRGKVSLVVCTMGKATTEFSFGNDIRKRQREGIALAKQHGAYRGAQEISDARGPKNCAAARLPGRNQHTLPEVRIQPGDVYQYFRQDGRE